MSSSYQLSTRCKSSEIEKKAAALGYASMIMCQCRRSSAFQLRTLNFWLAPAIDHQQILFFFDRSSTPIGYITWAHLARDTERRLLTDPNFWLHPCEWNEGGNTWIIDLCVPYGGVRDAIRIVRKFFLDDHITEVRWARRRADQSPWKVRFCTLKEQLL
jgi:cytolysin-activating lysine-acyltransferase